ncbi:putative calcium-binding protein [Burkholderiales bacterium JOSHI_001]|nr:putative calcium-binding protein [Burkholderiales bacterium JOSHI_001]
MKTTTIAAILLVALVLPYQYARAGERMYKCTIKGSTTYQNGPCPSDAPRDRPTVDQLNAERQRKLQEVKDNPPAASGPGAISVGTPAQSLPAAQGHSNAPSRRSFACDGRTYCSQMTSCAEAKYFLANCPNVKMDGNRDGVPCERQWCN